MERNSEPSNPSSTSYVEQKSQRRSDVGCPPGGRIQAVGDARKQRQTLERLKNLPNTEEELRQGRLSREQSDLISDAATANPKAEQQLLDDAKKKSVKDRVQFGPASRPGA